MPISKVNRLGLATDAQNYTIDTFTGDGSTVAFTLSQDPVSNTDLIVSVGGVLQAPTTNYSLSGTTLTFTGAPDATIPIMVTHLTYRNGAKEFTPDDGSVTSSKLAANIDVAGTLDVTGNLTADSNVIVQSGTPLIQLKDTDAVAGSSSAARMEMFDGSSVRTGWVGHGSSINSSLLLYSYHDNVKIGADRNNEGTDSEIIFEVDGTEVASIHPTGLSFDGGSNALDDYEEGTWTPILSDATSGGNVAIPTTVVGFYRKVGNLVTAWGTYNNGDINTNGLSGTLYIQGLPYASSVNGNLAAFTGQVYFNALSWTNTTAYWVCEVPDGGSYIGIRQIYSNTSGSASSLGDGNWNSGATDMRFTVVYATS